jgi:hypothetical protein
MRRQYGRIFHSPSRAILHRMFIPSTSLNPGRANHRMMNGLPRESNALFAGLFSAPFSIGTACKLSFESLRRAGLHFRRALADFHSEVCTTPAERKEEVLPRYINWISSEFHRSWAEFFPEFCHSRTLTKILWLLHWEYLTRVASDACNNISCSISIVFAVKKMSTNGKESEFLSWMKHLRGDGSLFLNLLFGGIQNRQLADRMGELQSKRWENHQCCETKLKRFWSWDNVQAVHRRCRSQKAESPNCWDTASGALPLGNAISTCTEFLQKARRGALPHRPRSSRTPTIESINRMMDQWKFLVGWREASPNLTAWCPYSPEWNKTMDWMGSSEGPITIDIPCGDQNLIVMAYITVTIVYALNWCWKGWGRTNIVYVRHNGFRSSCLI